jgi:hypothetical protein
MAFKMPCCTESNLFLSEMMSWGISIFTSILSIISLVVTNTKILELILKKYELSGTYLFSTGLRNGYKLY